MPHSEELKYYAHTIRPTLVRLYVVTGSPQTPKRQSTHTFLLKEINWEGNDSFLGTVDMKVNSSLVRLKPSGHFTLHDKWLEDTGGPPQRLADPTHLP